MFCRAVGDGSSRYCPICEAQMDTDVCPTDGVRTLPVTMRSASGAHLTRGDVIDGRYRIERPLGGGAMGAVYAATHLYMGRTVALKVLHEHSQKTQVEVKRFYREAKNASRIRHPHVVEILDFGIDESTYMPFLAMEFIEGRTLRDLIEDDAPFDLPRWAHLLGQAASALEAAQAEGVVHRDLKPENILVVEDGRGEHLKIVDFGIAKTVDGDDAETSRLTETGAIIGTPRYMAPEQVRGHPVDSRTDLYALGCIFFEGLTGHPPFVADKPVAVMMKHVSDPRPPLELNNGPDDVRQAASDLYAVLAAKDPDARPKQPDRVKLAFEQLAVSKAPDFEELGIRIVEDDHLVSIELPPGPTTNGDDATWLRTPSSSPQAPQDTKTPSAVPARRLARLAALLIAVAVVSTIWWATDGAPTVREPEAVPEAFAPAPGPGPSRRLAATASSATEPVLAPQPAKPPSPAGPVTIRFTGRPEMARVIRAGSSTPVCRSLPCRVDLPRSSEAVEFRIFARHHRDRVVRVVPVESQTKSVRLVPRLAAPTF